MIYVLLTLIYGWLLFLKNKEQDFETPNSVAKRILSDSY